MSTALAVKPLIVIAWSCEHRFMRLVVRIILRSRHDICRRWQDRTLTNPHLPMCHPTASPTLALFMSLQLGSASSCSKCQKQQAASKACGCQSLHRLQSSNAQPQHMSTKGTNWGPCLPMATSVLSIPVIWMLRIHPRPQHKGVEGNIRMVTATATATAALSCRLWVSTICGSTHYTLSIRQKS